MDKETRKEIARVLREARNTMNHSGRHWIQGYLKRKIRETDVTHEEKAIGEIGYCMLGGINAVTGTPENNKYRTMAKKALALEILRNTKGTVAGFALGKEPDTIKARWITREHPITLRAAEAIIISTNDNPDTRWPKVRNLLTDSARRISR